MSISRELPQSNSACQKALNTAVSEAKKTTNVLSADTTTRLKSENTNFDAAMTLVIDSKQVQRTASAAALAGRAKFHIFFGCYYTVLNCGIELGLIPRADRAYYDIDINNDRQPVINTDAELILCGQQVIDGDAKRVLAGGIAMAFPTIAEYTVVFNACKTEISNFADSKLVVLKAEAARKGLKAGVNKIIVRVWNEVETFHSELNASAMRAASRLFGVKYRSQGLPAFVTGIVTDSVPGLPIPKVVLHLEGVGTKFITDVEGKYTINTTLNGDLTILANLTNYTESETDILMVDGGKMELNIKMVEIIK